MKCGLFTLLMMAALCARAADPLPAPARPMLVVLNSGYSGNPFARYLAEILLGEGMVEFQQVELASLAADPDPQAFLNAFQIVLLAETDLSPPEEQLFRQYVWGGGCLIAMRPDRDLADLFGVTYAGPRAEQLLQFFAIDTTREPGTGLVSLSLQYHGQADDYTLNGATPLAFLWDSIATPSSNPAVVLHSFGNGRAAAFTFDLARSIVLLRQGNPEWKDSEGDALSGYRPMDMFFRLTGETWLAPERTRIPQADEAQRLLANLVLSMPGPPLPRLWYLPNAKKAILVNTGDGEDMAGTQLDPTLNDIASYGGHFTLYLRESGIAGTVPDKEASWRAAGHETGPHVYGGGPDNCDVLGPAYQQIVANLQAKFGHGARTARSHTIDWCGWSAMAGIEAANGTELDVNYYHYIPFLLSYGENANGYFTGSGLPQKFCDENGNVLSIYQSLTEWPDEWFDDSGYTADQAAQIVRDMFSSAQNGSYSAFVANIHPARYDNIGGDITHAWANQIWAYAQTNDIPLWSAEKLLDFVLARNAARFDNFYWSNNTLAFDFTAPISGQDLTVMVPAFAGTNVLLSISFAGNPLTASIQTIKGREYALFTTPAAAGRVVVTYGRDTTPPNVSNLRVENVTDTSATLTWSTAEPADSRLAFGLSASNLINHVSSATLLTSHRLDISALSPNTIYHCQVTSVDRAGNPASSSVLTFSTSPLRWVQTTTADFSGGTRDGVIVSEDGNGELRLPPALYDRFVDNLAATQWVSGQWSGGIFTPAIANGVMTLTNPGGGAYLRSVATFRPGTSLQCRIKFSRGGNGTAPFLYFGLASTNLAPWALLGTGYTGDQFYASLYNYRSGDPVMSPLGNLFDQWHDFKLVWEYGRVEFWIDGLLCRTESVALPGPLHVFFSAAADTPSSASVTAEWVRVEQYGSVQFNVSSLLSDTFNEPSGPALNWVSLTNPIPSTGVWSVVNHRLAHNPAGISYHPAVLKNSFPPLASFNFQTLAMSPDTTNGFFGLVWGLQDERRYYMAQFYPGQGMRVYRTDNWVFTKIGDVPGAPIPAPGRWFTLRLEARSGAFLLYVDGALQAAINDHTYATGRVGVMGYGGTTSRYDDVLIESIASVSTPCNPGVYTSVIFDAGWKTTWQELTWTGSTPAGSVVSFQTRSGDTPVADASWSEWQQLTSPISSPESRYFQFLATLTTSSILLSPVVEQVQVIATPTQEVPRLDLLLAHGSFILRWPAWAGGSTLFSTTNLAPPVVWTPLSPDNVVTNGYFQRVLVPTNSLEFFRLASP